MSRYPGLDLVRSIAIIWVMLFHGWYFGYGTPVVAIAKHGAMGVDLFFALSGFLIGSQLLKVYAEGRTPAFGEFYRRRAFRILPAYLVVLALYFTVPAFSEVKGIQPLWQFLTFTQNLKYDAAHSRAFSHSWSLCVEEYFYLLFPLIAFFLMRKPSWQKTAWVVAGIVLGGIALRAWVWINLAYPDTPIGVVPESNSVLWLERLYYPTWCRLDGILAGVCVAAIRCFRPAIWEKMMRHATVVLAAGVGCVALYIVFLAPPRAFNASVFGYPLTALGLALIVAAAASPHGLIAKIKLPGIQLTALMAYSTYLMHKQAFRWVKVYFPSVDATPGAVQFIVYAAAGIGSGAALYYAIELPFLKLRDRLERGSVLATAPTVPKPAEATAS